MSVAPRSLLPWCIRTAIAATVMLAAPTLAAAPDAPRSVVAEPTSLSDPDLQGVWQSDGYGWIIRIAQGKLEVFNFAGSLCQPDPAGDADQLFVTVSKADRNHVRLAASSDDTWYPFRRIARLPKACLAPPPPPGAFIAATLGQFYPGFGPRRINRSTILNDLRGADRIAADKDRFARISGALERLSDAHVSLSLDRTPDGLEARFGESAFLASLPGDPRFGPDPARRVRVWLESYRAGILALLGPEGKLVANNRIFVGRIGRLGYLNILTMGGFEARDDSTEALDRELDAALQTFAGLDGMILDVTNNRGGYDAIGRHIAARFTQRPTTIYAKRAWAGRSAWQPFTATPLAGKATFTGPIWLVTSGITVSGGESFTLAMRSFPNVVHLGETTRGDLSDRIPKRLAGGWSFSLAAERYRDGAGREWEGLGVPPQVPFPIDLAEHAKSIAALAEAIRDGRIRRE